MGDSTPLAPDKPRRFRRPVGWLLGPQLIGALKRIVLYDLYKDQLDPRDWMRAEPVDLSGEADGAGEYWFDYLADAGDGQKAMYSIAYLALADLWEKDGALSFSPSPGARRMPRGAFLFCGGDTAYHVADAPTLAAQFQAPFVWACREHGIPEADDQLDEDDDRVRWLFGIPGNHDYYDQLSGFNRQFRRPVTGERGRHDGKPARLRVPAFRRRQEASYVCLRLPFGWQLWGLDTENGEIDVRQAEHFLAQAPADKLIVATPEPTTVFGRRCTDRRLLASFRKLGLEREFLGPEAGELVPEGRCRLDISGDVHHYERYGGGPGARYASVVAGLGGAFHHPTETDFHAVARDAVYPSEAASSREVAWRLFWPPTLILGGFIFAVGAAIALLLARAGMRSPAIVEWLRRLWAGEGGAIDPAFARSLGVLGAILAAFGLARLAGILARRHHDLARPERRRPIHWYDKWGAYLAALAAPLVVGVAIARLGDAPAKAVLWDLGFAGTIAGVVVGLVAFGAAAGGKYHSAGGKVGFALLGLVHAFLQLATPFALLCMGPWRAAGFLLGTLLVGLTIGRVSLITDGDRRARRAQRIVTTALFLGAAAAVPLLAASGAPPVADGRYHARLALAAVLGAWTSCLWLGWYLAVALAWNGHNNEAGAACRIEKFKQLVRIRITPEELRGWVIAVDEPGAVGAQLRPKIVDEFSIRPFATASAGTGRRTTPAASPSAGGAATQGA